jgi:hypothetical protein
LPAFYPFLSSSTCNFSSSRNEGGEEQLPHAGLLARRRRHRYRARPGVTVGQPEAPALCQGAAPRRGRRHRGRREGCNQPAPQPQLPSTTQPATPTSNIVFSGLCLSLICFFFYHLCRHGVDVPIACAGSQHYCFVLMATCLYVSNVEIMPKHISPRHKR